MITAVQQILRCRAQVIEEMLVQMWTGKDAMAAALADTQFDSWAVAQSDQDYLPAEFAACWVDHLVAALKEWQSQHYHDQQQQAMQLAMEMDRQQHDLLSHLVTDWQ